MNTNIALYQANVRKAKRLLMTLSPILIIIMVISYLLVEPAPLGSKQMSLQGGVSLLVVGVCLVTFIALVGGLVVSKRDLWRAYKNHGSPNVRKFCEAIQEDANCIRFFVTLAIVVAGLGYYLFWETGTLDLEWRIGFSIVAALIELVILAVILFAVINYRNKWQRLPPI